MREIGFKSRDAHLDCLCSDVRGNAVILHLFAQLISGISQILIEFELCFQQFCLYFSTPATSTSISSYIYMEGDLSIHIATLIGQIVTAQAKTAALALRFTEQRDFLTSLSEKLETGRGFLAALRLEDPAVTRYCLGRCMRLVRVYTEQLTQGLEVALAARRLKKRYIGEIQIAAAKLRTLLDILPSAAYMRKEDLMSGENTKERLASLGKVVTLFRFGDPVKLAKHVKKMVEAITAGNAFITKAHETPGPARSLTLGLGALYYNLFKKKALFKARVGFANPNVDIAKGIWSLMDSKMVAPVMETLVTGIRTNKRIFVPRISLQEAREEDWEERRFCGKKRQGEERVPIRILADFPISLTEDAPMCAFPVSHKAIFHIHGGGFIAMSSRSHQNYSRRWAKATGAVLFSVDYRLAPEFPFPAALDDVWAAYLWVKTYARSLLGVDISEMVVTGDSAGGNLSCGVVNRAIETGIPGLIPDGVLLTYPALCLDVVRYSPSLELALEDLIVHHTFLRLCLESYIQSAALNPATDYFISPLHTPTANLLRFPALRIMVGNCDPLGDDSWRLVERLYSLGKDVHMTEYEGLPHGFLGFDLPVNGVKETRDAVNQGIAYLQELLHIESS